MIIKQKLNDLNSLALDLNKPQKFEVSLTLFKCKTFLLSVDIDQKDEFTGKTVYFSQEDTSINRLATKDLEAAYEWLQKISDKVEGNE